MRAYSEVRVRIKTDLGPRKNIESRVEYLLTSFLQQIRGMVGKIKNQNKIKAKFCCFLNQLVKPLDKWFQNCKTRLISQLLISL